MKRIALVVSFASLCLFPSGVAHAQSASLEVSGATLNRVVNKIGVLSDGGIAATYNRYELGDRFTTCVPVAVIACPGVPGALPGMGGEGMTLVGCRTRGGEVGIVPGDPVAWQWWITDARLDVGNGSMTFTATATTRIGDAWQTVRKTAPATVRFDAGDNRLKVDIGDFKVSLGAAGTLDVAKLFHITIPVVPQQIAVPMPDGTTKTVTGRVASATVEYQADKLKVNFDVAF